MRLRSDPAFRRFWLASSVSDTGTAAGVLALAVLVEGDLSGSATDLGLVNAARWAPYLLLGLFAGVLADRVRRRPLLVVTDAGRAVVLAAVPVLALAGLLTVPSLAALLVVFGALSVANDAAHQSFLPHLVPTASLARANGRLQQSAAVAQTGGPLLGGGLAGWLGAPFAVLLDALTYAASAVLLARLPADDVPERPGRRSVRADVREGMRWIHRHPTLRPLAIGTHVWFLFHSALLTAWVFVALDVLEIGAAGLGVATAAAGAAAPAGALASERLVARLGLVAVVAGSRVLHGAGFAVAAAGAAVVGPVAATAVAAAGLALYGFGMGAEGPPELAYRQAVTPGRLQGRTNATMRSLNRAAVVAGAPLGGSIADAAGPLVALGVGATGVAVAGVGLLASGFRRASMP